MVAPAFTLNDIDNVITRHSLRNIFDFVGKRNYKGFRFNLYLVGMKTLVVEPAEEEHTLDRGPEDSGTACERGFTKNPPHLEETEGHYRTIRYSIGALQCAVQCEVDACHEEPSPIDTDPGNTGSFSVTISTCDSAEIKTTRSGCKVKRAMPKLWFGRMGWFICGRIKGPTVSWNKPLPVGGDAEAIDLDNWAFQERVNLAKLAVVLSKLRVQVQKCGGKRCVAVCPAHSTRLSVYPQQTARGTLPDDLLRRFWPPSVSLLGNRQ
ncbi:hypothetical protein GCG54_00008619 [Colletotrichum gloeosporioides]|uniref:Uncharacterized protein n=1 Tax=Colletotrichum gloeosporioides TaxID=474922 RepID=A0A8H4CK12_COLGL|nr:uncharacterized protein GCG54_00008619 [Colletotrichum gloeosporioides]KAF3805388.1 hypothetical protein GCG54_00008619 [Colletotrichum gloeosporioides]